MTTVTEIEAVIRQLPESEARQLSAWLVDYLEDMWDAKIKADVESGRLNAFITKVEAEIAAGDVRSLDEVLLLAKQYSDAEVSNTQPKEKETEQFDQAELKRRWAEWVEDLEQVEIHESIDLANYKQVYQEALGEKYRRKGLNL